MRMSIFVALIALTGCGTLVRSSFPLSPAVTDPKLGVWVFIEGNWKSDTGVYRCQDSETGEPVCKKAQLEN